MAHLFDERNHAVKLMLQMALAKLTEGIAKARQNNHRQIGICGQAPSDYPEIAEFLVQQGINSISLNPDLVLKTRLHIAEVKQNIGVAFIRDGIN